jgi:REP element-mobilizing transposase RayT
MPPPSRAGLKQSVRPPPSRGRGFQSVQPRPSGRGKRPEKNGTLPRLLRVLYLVTFTCYGSNLPGDHRGSFDHVRQGERRVLQPNPGLESYARRQMRQAPYLLQSRESRELVRDAIMNVCEFRGWILYALQVRTSHVHGIVDAAALPCRILNDWKAYATRSLGDPGRIHWTHGGSTRRILTPTGLTRAMHYVLYGQGEQLQTYWADPRLS